MGEVGKQQLSVRFFSAADEGAPIGKHRSQWGLVAVRGTTGATVLGWPVVYRGLIGKLSGLSGLTVVCRSLLSGVDRERQFPVPS